MSIRIATWNLCLGLLNKKDLVLDELTRHSIDICCMQEVELNSNVPVNILTNGQFNFEPELNTTKKRVGVYINKNVGYRRRDDLEEPNLHLIIIDVMLKIPFRIITLYRAFQPPDGTPFWTSSKNKFPYLIVTEHHVLLSSGILIWMLLCSLD